MSDATLHEPWAGDRGKLGGAARDQTLVVKLGGSVKGEDTLPQDVALLQRLGARIVLVHGGGPLITRWLDRIGKETRFVGGLRYTDPETLDVVRMVLGGLVNGEVAAKLAAAGARAIGLSGSDDGLLEAIDRDPRLGLVGRITRVNVEPVQLVLGAGYAAVVAPVAVAPGGRFLNVNADAAAAEIALALGARRLIYLTDVDGITEDVGDRPVRRLGAARARELIAAGVIAGGMIPKVEGCIRALPQTGVAQIVDGRRPHALLDVLSGGDGLGTTVVA